MPMKPLIWTLVGLIVFLIVSSIGISTYVGWKLTHTTPTALDDSPARLGMTFEPIQFQSREDHLNLKGWYLPGKSLSSEDGTPVTRPNIIMAHGYDNNRLQKKTEALNLAKELVDRGYNVLMFDFRHSGESEGTLTSVGYFEKYDLLGAIDWMKAKHPGKIGLLGFSMGASTSLMAAADEPSVAGVVADSPFNHLGHYLQENLPVWSHLPNFPFTPLIMTILPRMTGIDPNGVDALSAVDRIYPRPILFIHSSEDPSIPYQNSESMWEKHKDKFDFWMPNGEGHAKNYPNHKQEYVEKVTSFFEKL
ncbi:alpha/beta fold hydrolase [Paenibacillus cremeus]|uniref:Alpha/beta fold hydrolase n=2 Tax=Paenibacillus cremeus TaxID=2163881 RepID=A0A559JPX0_9BACL|nr:alpha/beta fold hydrolase [Paenibacillus cremeus]